MILYTQAENNQPPEFYQEKAESLLNNKAEFSICVIKRFCYQEMVYVLYKGKAIQLI